ncbi:MAG: ATP-dependent helicase [Candidatus Omnitrophica bacterium]|nr:ATP-dependent helicase [Candidatus Omnitrophota bacterium]
MTIDAKAGDLNEAQRRAVDYAGGHLLIVAGPGTGKTHTLIHRIGRTARRLLDEEKLLAITFTNKAAEELEERLARDFPQIRDKVFVGTFHRFCLCCLKEHVRDAGLPTAFRVASTRECEALAKGLWPDLGKRRLKQKILSISGYKTSRFTEETPSDVAAYNAALRAGGLWDYDDLLLEALKLLSAGNAAGYSSVFVDEYQDINAVQHALLKELVRQGANLTAIGDPNQAIYGFRGADVGFFESFQKDFPQALVLSLSDNYRSAPNLLKASGQVVSRENTIAVAPLTHSAPLCGALRVNPEQAPFFKAGGVEGLTAKIYTEGRLTVYEAPTDKAEAEYVVHQIERMVGGTSLFSRDSGRVAAAQKAERGFGDIAVLYRLNAQRVALQEAFERHGIPYQTSGDRPFVELTPIAELMTLLKALRGTGTLHDAMAGLPQTAAGEKIFKDIRPASQENVGRFVRMSRRFDQVGEFLDYLVLQQPEDAVDPRAEYVHLMTLHASKGLEFPVVFIAGCEEGLLPLSLEGMTADPGEERRLFYVGMTRAKEALVLTHSRRRHLWGRRLSGRPSSYLDDIEHQLKEYERASPARRPGDRDKSRQMEFFPSP